MQATTKANKSVKFTFKEEIRRFNLTPDNQNLQYLVQTIKDLTHLSDTPFVIKYLDDENEWITIDRDIEFETALLLSEGLLRLHVSLQEEDKPQGDHSPRWRGRMGACRGRFRGRGRRGCRRAPGLRDTMENTECDSETLSNSDENASEPVWHKFKRRNKYCRGNGKWKGQGRKWKGKCGRRFRDDETTTSDSFESVDPNLTVEEMKAQVQKLVESKKVIQDNLKEANQKLQTKKAEIAQSRKNPDTTGEQLAALRAEMVELKTAKFAVRTTFCSTKREICQLRQAIRAKKSETSENPSEE
jgi:hypothetical protein